jgi:hypothetical protein
VLIRARSSARNPGQATGYAVSLAGDVTKSGNPVWFDGGKLAADLTLPKLRQRWPGTNPPAPRAPLAEAERAAAWDQALRAVDAATAHIRAMTTGAQDGGANAAWAAAGTMHVAAALLGSRSCGRPLMPTTAPPGRPGRGSRRPPGRQQPALRRPGASGPCLCWRRPRAPPGRAHRPAGRVAEAVAAMRESQQRATQAASTLSAARHLQAVAGPAAFFPDGAFSQVSQSVITFPVGTCHSRVRCRGFSRPFSSAAAPEGRQDCIKGLL